MRNNPIAFKNHHIAVTNVIKTASMGHVLTKTKQEEKYD